MWFVSDHLMGLVPTICCTIKILVKANRMNFSTCVISAMFQKFLCICVCGWLGLRMKLIPQYTLFKAINILPFSLMPWDLGVNFKLLLAGSLREFCNSLRAYTGNWVLIEACLVSSWVGCYYLCPWPRQQPFWLLNNCFMKKQSKKSFFLPV